MPSLHPYIFCRKYLLILVHILPFGYFVPQSSGVNIIIAEQATSQLPSYEEHSGCVASSDVAMEDNPAYQPLEAAAADLSTGTIDSEYYNI